MADKAYITPNILKWARESATAKVSVSADKLKEWEEGISQSTIQQAQILAKAYKRSFTLFFLPEIPRDIQPLQDYRKRGSKELTTSSIFIIHEIQQKQVWISEVYEGNKKEDKLPLEKITVSLINSWGKNLSANSEHKTLVDSIRGCSLAYPWVIAYAMDKSSIVVTKKNKETAINSKRIRIPNVYENMGVRWINDFKFIDKLDINFSCSLT